MTAPTRTRPAITRLAAVVALTMAGMLTLAGPASAHTELTGSDPTDGATVTAPPASITLTFNEQVQAFEPTVVVTGPDAAPYTAGDPIPDGTTITAPLTPLGPAGPYTVAYRIVSADDHPVTGQITFTYAPAPSPTSGAGPTPSTPPPAAEPSAPPNPSPSPATSSSSTTTEAAVTTPTLAATDTGPAAWIWVTATLAGALLLAGLAWTITRNRRRGAG